MIMHARARTRRARRSEDGGKARAESRHKGRRGVRRDARRGVRLSCTEASRLWSMPRELVIEASSSTIVIGIEKSMSATSSCGGERERVGRG